MRRCLLLERFCNLSSHIGCGTGGQTMVLAQNVQGTITGIDLSAEFINRFTANANKLNLQRRVKGIVGSMDNLPFRDEEFDLIWSEGAIYNIGLVMKYTLFRAP